MSSTNFPSSRDIKCLATNVTLDYVQLLKKELHILIWRLADIAYIKRNKEKEKDFIYIYFFLIYFLFEILLRTSLLSSFEIQWNVVNVGRCIFLFARLTRRNHRESHTKERHLCPVHYGCTRRWVRESRKPCKKHCTSRRTYAHTHTDVYSREIAIEITGWNQARPYSQVRVRAFLSLGKYSSLGNAWPKLPQALTVIIYADETITIDCHAI